MRQDEAIASSCFRRRQIFAHLFHEIVVNTDTDTQLKQFVILPSTSICIALKPLCNLIIFFGIHCDYPDVNAYNMRIFVLLCCLMKRSDDVLLTSFKHAVYEAKTNAYGVQSSKKLHQNKSGTFFPGHGVGCAHLRRHGMHRPTLHCVKIVPRSRWWRHDGLIVMLMTSLQGTLARSSSLLYRPTLYVMFILHRWPTLHSAKLKWLLRDDDVITV